jgi:hypothetical protein
MTESHCAVESLKNLSLSKEQGEASGIAGKSGGQQGAKEAGCRDHGTQLDHNLFARVRWHHRIRQARSDKEKRCYQLFRQFILGPFNSEVQRGDFWR